jgi:alpha-L-fucosidase
LDQRSEGETLNLGRRSTLKLLGAGVGALLLRKASDAQMPQLTPGTFVATRDSLSRYTIPGWFADAKFGIWSHWGPQSAVGDGDWYARNMYVEGSAQYQYHRQRFGPQSKVGYKDLISLFTADKWDPEALMDLYANAGAKYFFSMGVHHDNFDMWNSKYQPRWNAVAAGPKKDIVGLWAAAARKRGIRFGVSDHLSNSYDWFAPSHRSDTNGQYAGLAYDGADPAYADLYHNYAGEPTDFINTAKAMGRVAPEQWKLEYVRRIKDLIDQHQPDLLYTDGGIPFDEYGLTTVAEEYNLSASLHHGHVESIYNSKAPSDCTVGTCVLDRERGVLDGIQAQPWQTDTCIGEWHYKKGIQYKSAKKVIDLLVDIVSKNGNLLLNFPLPASGELDSEERVVLSGITDWMKRNSEGIYGSRPWKIYGEGPSTLVKPAAGMNEDKQPDLTAQDIRFTTKGGHIYAFIQGWPQGDFVVRALGRASAQNPGRIASVDMLGYDRPLHFKQEDATLRVTAPSIRPENSTIGVTLRIHMS